MIRRENVGPQNYFCSPHSHGGAEVEYKILCFTGGDLASSPDVTLSVLEEHVTSQGPCFLCLKCGMGNKHRVAFLL